MYFVKVLIDICWKQWKFVLDETLWRTMTLPTCTLLLIRWTGLDRLSEKYFQKQKIQTTQFCQKYLNSHLQKVAFVINRKIKKSLQINRCWFPKHSRFPAGQRFPLISAAVSLLSATLLAIRWQRGGSNKNRKAWESETCRRNSRQVLLLSNSNPCPTSSHLVWVAPLTKLSGTNIAGFF